MNAALGAPMRKAVRMSDGASGATAEALAAQGWTRRFTAVGKRLDEMVQLYSTLGYEVRLEREGRTEEMPSDACEQCIVVTLARTVYTRRSLTAGASVVSGGDD